MTKRAVAEMIVHLGRLAYTDGVVGGLTPAQWAGLRYFALANRFSRTPSAFAEYHGTTRGTASQLTKTLVTQGHLTRRRSETDGRSTRLDLTDKAWALLADDPFQVLVEAAGALTSRTRGQLSNALERLLSDVARKRCTRPFGTCTKCDYLSGGGQCRGGQATYHCRFIGVPLVETDLGHLCVNFAPAGSPRTERSLADERLE